MSESYDAACEVREVIVAQTEEVHQINIHLLALVQLQTRMVTVLETLVKAAVEKDCKPFGQL
jgi:hypothetical protein